MEHSSSRPHELTRRRRPPVWSINRLLIALIGFYQRRISPRKGWRCAYSVLHGGTGCSGYAHEAIETYGWRVAIPLVRQRFRDCHSAAQTMRARRLQLSAGDGSGGLGPGPGPGPGPGRRNRAAQGGDGSDPACDACGFVEDLPFCGGDNSSSSSSCHMPDFSGCHIGGCDSCNCDGCDGCDSCNCGN
ncbi:membrane protein insertion efficiency factor YidD [bacterium]|nr:MAG: membrane protein insertion efficiency factor YidD [bacterium]